MSTLEASYRYARGVARARARNFYYSFLLLPRPKRDAMCAIYAFMRVCDDLSDDRPAGDSDGALAALDAWRGQFHGALAGERNNHPLWPALCDTLERYAIPAHYLDEMIEGVASDHRQRPIETFDDLYQYCYLVASVVGLTITHIFGFREPRALEFAEQCGIAFQLTNILRDVGEDAAAGRVYLPAAELKHFGVAAAELRAVQVSPALRALLRFEAARAAEYYARSRPLLALVDPDSRASLWALVEIYRRLLERIEARDYEVLATRVRLPGWEKAAIALKAWTSGGRV